MAADNGSQWDEVTLSMACFFYNISVHQTTGYSPQFVFLGQKPKIPLDLFLNLKDVETETQASYLQELRKAIGNMPINAYEAFKKSYNLSGNKRFKRNNELVAGMKVLIRNFRKSSKFDKNFLDDFEIVKKISAGSYLVLNNRTKRYSRVNIRDIKIDKSNIENIDTDLEEGNQVGQDSDEENIQGENENENDENGNKNDENDHFDDDPGQNGQNDSKDGKMMRSGRVSHPVERLNYQ